MCSCSGRIRQCPLFCVLCFALPLLPLFSLFCVFAVNSDRCHVLGAQVASDCCFVVVATVTESSSILPTVTVQTIKATEYMRWMPPAFQPDHKRVRNFMHHFTAFVSDQTNQSLPVSVSVSVSLSLRLRARLFQYSLCPPDRLDDVPFWTAATPSNLLIGFFSFSSSYVFPSSVFRPHFSI